MKQLLALCVGINEYPNAPLYGCVNDANDWADVLEAEGYIVIRLLDHAATKDNILGALKHLFDKARWGDRVVFTFSGHGSWIPDRSGDEPDQRDEVLCAFDYEQGGFIVDDELQRIVSIPNRRRGVRVTIIPDSCHSGSVSRFVGSAKAHMKYVPPFSFLTGEMLSRAEDLSMREAYTAPRSSKDAVLFSGCADDEVSWDAFLDGRYNGAFTFHMLKARLDLHREGKKVTYKDWYYKVREYLPHVGRFDQTPQMYASLWQRRWTL